MKIRKLMFTHLGNGVSIYDANTIDPNTNDYLKLAYIDYDRHIAWSNRKGLNRRDLELILGFAGKGNMSISATQCGLALSTKFKVRYVVTGKDKNGRRFKPIYTFNPQYYNLWSGTIWELQKDGSRKKWKYY